MGAIRVWTTPRDGTPKDEENYLQRGRTGGVKVEGANVLPEDMLFRFLDTNGDGTGGNDSANDYSVTPEEFLITAPAGYEYILERMIVKIQDGNAGFDAEAYGGLSELTNGVHIRVYNAGGAVALDLMDGLPARSNVQWARYAFDAEVSDFGAGDNFFRVRWTFSRSGNPLVLQPGYSLRALMQDNLSGLVAQHIMVQGWRRQV